MQGDALFHKRFLLKSFLFLFALFTSHSTFAQEICDNGKDDDGDNLIDLKDPKCQCQWKATGNLLLNPSFEELNHCTAVPFTYTNNKDVAKYWDYGVQPYHDVYYALNFSCPNDISLINANPPALPLPDGQDFVRFDQDYFADLSKVPKGAGRIYIAQCLQRPLVKDRSYTLTFFGGRFKRSDRDNFYPFPFNVAVFGNRDCNAVPFGEAYKASGCPAGWGWTLLGQTKVFSPGEWVQGKIEFTVPENVNVIEIGPDCSELGDTAKDRTTFFLDNLQLEETQNFHFRYIQLQSGNSCSGGFVLQAPTIANATYQWYKDSIALVGETSNLLHLPDAWGTAVYNVRIGKGGECQISEPYAVQRSLLSTIRLPTDTVTCESREIKIGQSFSGISYSCDGKTDTVVTLTRNGRYFVTASDSLGCTRNFTVNATFKNCVSCPVFLPNAFTPNGDGKNEQFKGNLNCPIATYRLQVYNRWGQKIFESNSVSQGWDGTQNGVRVPVGVYIYLLEYKISSDDSHFQTKRGTVAIMR